MTNPKKKAPRLLKPRSPEGFYYNRLPPPGSKARQEIERKELATRMEITELHEKLQREADPKFQAAQRAFEEYLDGRKY